MQPAGGVTVASERYALECGVRCGANVKSAKKSTQTANVSLLHVKHRSPGPRLRTWKNGTTPRMGRARRSIGPNCVPGTVGWKRSATSWNSPTRSAPGLNSTIRVTRNWDGDPGPGQEQEQPRRDVRGGVARRS